MEELENIFNALSETISIVGTPTGEKFPKLNIIKSYETTGSTSDLGHIIEYQFDWGDGTFSPWSTKTSSSHSWNKMDIFYIKVRARCQEHNEIINTSDILEITVNSDNLLNNPEFEIVTNPTSPFAYPTGWNNASSSFPNHKNSDNIEKYQGNWSYKINYQETLTSPHPYNIVWQKFDIQRGDIYLLSAMTKIKEGDYDATPRIRLNWGTKQSVAYATNTHLNEWKEITLFSPRMPGDVTSASFLLEMPNGSNGTAWFDNASVITIDGLTMLCAITSNKFYSDDTNKILTLLTHVLDTARNPLNALKLIVGIKTSDNKNIMKNTNESITEKWQEASFDLSTITRGEYIAYFNLYEKETDILLKEEIILFEIIDDIKPEKMSGNLYFSPDKIQEIINNPAYDELKNKFLDRIKQISVPTTYNTSTYYRSYGLNLEHLTMAYILTKDSTYLTKTINFMTNMASWPSWSYVGGGDLQKSQWIMGLSFAYNYMYDYLSEELKKTIICRLIDEIYERYEFNKASFILNNADRNSLLGNHLWINAAAVHQGSVALENHLPLTSINTYIPIVLDLFVNKIIPLLPEDGAGQEGADYSLYGLIMLLRVMETERQKGNDLYNNSTYFNLIPYYIRYMTMPDATSNTKYVNVGDSTNGRYWYSPQAMSRLLANIFSDSNIQNFAEAPEYNCFDYDPMATLIWYNPKLTSTEVLEKSKYFETTGEIIYRDNWTQDNSLYVYFTCTALKTGHLHPDQNHFIIGYKGEHLITDPGFTYLKTTQEHNTLIVNDYGQTGEHYVWLPGDKCSNLAHIEDYCYSGYSENGNYSHWTGIASNAYRPQCELQTYKRNMTILDKYIFVTDEVKTQSPKQLQINFHNSRLNMPNNTIDTENRFNIEIPNEKASLSLNQSQIIFYTDPSKVTTIEPTFAALQSYSGKTADAWSSYCGNYCMYNNPQYTKTTPEVIADFATSGVYPWPQHGSHLAQSTTEPTTNSWFNNLLIVGDFGTINSNVINIQEENIVGYKIEEENKTITYLFNTSNNTYPIEYKSFVLKGTEATIVQDHINSSWNYFTKNAFVWEGTSPTKPVGNQNPTINVSELYTSVESTNNLEHSVEYSFDWGDGTQSEWLPVVSGYHAWNNLGEFNVNITMRCTENIDICKTSEILIINVLPEETITNPGTITGNEYPITNINEEYKVVEAISNLDKLIEYQFDWGDGTQSEWSLLPSNSHNWNIAGIYKIFVIARSQNNIAISGISPVLTINVSPEETIAMPSTPIGTTTAFVNVNQIYSTNILTTNWGHPVEYSFDWGDGTFSPWSTSIMAFHSWKSIGIKNITVTARCKLHPVLSSTSFPLTIEVIKKK